MIPHYEIATIQQAALLIGNGDSGNIDMRRWDQGVFTGYTPIIPAGKRFQLFVEGRPMTRGSEWYTIASSQEYGEDAFVQPVYLPVPIMPPVIRLRWESNLSFATSSIYLTAKRWRRE